MKYRFLFPLLLLSLFLLPFSSSYTTASKKRSSDEKKIKNWIEQRINSQLEGRVDPRGFRFPEQQQEQSTEVDTKRFSYKQAKDPFVDFLINGTLTNTRANDPRFETGARVQNGTSSAVSGQDIVVAYNDIGTEFSAVSYSNDGGRTWSQTFIPQFAEGKNFGSGVVAAGTGLFYYAGLAQNRSGATVIIISRSTDGGRNWSVPIQVFPQNVLGVIQDKPWIAVDNTNSPNAGNVYVGWTEIRASGSRIDFAASTDGGKTFPNGIALTPFDPRFNLQGINIAVGAEGEVYAAWGDLNVRGIRFARSANAGQSFALIDTAVSVTTYELIGPLLNSHFSVNGLPSIAVDKSQTSSRGNIYITFNSPVPGKNADKADVFFIRSTDRGASWSSPLRVNNDIGNTDQFMPSVAVATDGTVGVMWYDRSNDPKFNALLDVFAAISKDGGKSFLPSRRITTANWLVLPTPITIRNNYHGDYNQMSALTDRAGFLFAWGDDRSGLDPDVYTAVLETSDLEQPIAGLTISPVIPSQTVIAGQGTILRVKLKRVGGLASGVNDSVTFSATSDTDSISFDFDRNNISSGDEVALFAKTSATTSSGTHPVVVKATVNGFTTTSTLRLNVVAQSQFARLPFNISRSAGRSIQPNLFVDQTNNLHAVWGDNTEANFRIVYSKSKDSSSFTLPVTVSQNTNRTALNSQVNVDKNGNIHVVWQECMGSDCKVMYSRSVDQGSSFSVPQNLSPTLDFSELPTIATTDSEVVVFWNGVQSLISLGFEIFNARSTDGGATFSPTGVVASGGAGNLYNAAVSNDGNGKTYLAYENCLSGGCQIEVLRSTGNLSSFSKVGTASQGINFAFKPSISAIATGEVYVSMSGALSDGDSRFEIFTSVSRDNGNSFTRVQNVSNTPEFSSESTILATENSVYLAWVDRSTGNSEILLSRSNDKGASFIPAVNLTGNITISQAPTLATSASKDVFLIFEDEVDGNDDIYFSLIDGVDRPAKIVQLDPDNGPVGTSFRI
ncbi:MAG: exo-alpha-sialidase, partial [Blastocatellia bacterium]|nr:exo-alpha-sialidase [Blastocatellia bacterium]